MFQSLKRMRLTSFVTCPYVLSQSLEFHMPSNKTNICHKITVDNVHDYNSIPPFYTNLEWFILFLSQFSPFQIAKWCCIQYTWNISYLSREQRRQKFYNAPRALCPASSTYLQRERLNIVTIIRHTQIHDEWKEYGHNHYEFYKKSLHSWNTEVAIPYICAGTPIERVRNYWNC